MQKILEEGNILRSIRSKKDLPENEHEYWYDEVNSIYVFKSSAFKDRKQSPSVYCMKAIGKPENRAKLGSNDGLIKLDVKDILKIEKSKLCFGPVNKRQQYFLIVTKEDDPNEIDNIKREAHHIIASNPVYTSKEHFCKVRNLLATLATAVGFFEIPIENHDKHLIGSEIEKTSTD